MYTITKRALAIIPLFLIVAVLTVIVPSAAAAPPRTFQDGVDRQRVDDAENRVHSTLLDTPREARRKRSEHREACSHNGR